MEILEDRFYSQDHVWVKTLTDETVVGITSYAVEQLGRVDYVELAAPGDRVVRDAVFAVVETSKAVTELVAPISGTVVASNTKIEESPELIGEDPYGNGWLIRVQPSDLNEFSILLKPLDYAQLIGSEIES